MDPYKTTLHVRRVVKLTRWGRVNLEDVIGQLDGITMLLVRSEALETFERQDRRHALQRNSNARLLFCGTCVRKSSWNGS